MNNIKANYGNEDDRREIAIQIVINNALEKGTLVKGISEVLKAIELRKVKCVFLAEDCNNDKYIDIIKSVSIENNIPLIMVDTWEHLRDYCHLGIPCDILRKIALEKGKPVKIKPKCSSCAIIEWGDIQEGNEFILRYCNNAK